MNNKKQMHCMENITTAVILAGGLGTRLRAAVNDRPKVLAEVGGRTFLSLLLDKLANSNIKRVVLCTGYMGKDVRAAFGKKYFEMDIICSKEKELLGTGGALRLALPLIINDPVLVMNGDSYCNINIASFLEWHKKKESAASIALTFVENTSKYGKVQLGDYDEISRFEEKVEKQGPGWINAGIYLMQKSLIHSIPPDTYISIEKELFQAWTGKRFYGYQSKNRFLDIGTPDTYSRADDFFLQIIKKDIREK